MSPLEDDHNHISLSAMIKDNYYYIFLMLGTEPRSWARGLASKHSTIELNLQPPKNLISPSQKVKGFLSQHVLLGTRDKLFSFCLFVWV